MKSFNALLESKGIKAGAQIEIFYGNGSKFCDATITRISDYFVFHQKSHQSAVGYDWRDSHSLVLQMLRNGTWRVKK